MMLEIINRKLYILFCVAVLLMSCNENNTGTKKVTQNKAKDTLVHQSKNNKKEGPQNSNHSKKDFTKIKKQSFVLSCGSGCAMTYHIKDVHQINEIKIKVAFDVDMYVDEVLTESFKETYTFMYNGDLKIEKITRDGEEGNVLDNLIGGALQTFKDFAAQLISYESL